MEQFGYWVFKNRSLVPLPWLTYLWWIGPGQQTGNALLVFTLVVVGESLRLWGVGCGGGRTRTRAKEVEKLMTTGPYRYLRNPLYVGNFLLYGSLPIYYARPYVLCFVMLYTAAEYSLIVFFEEHVLEQTFGKEYALYRSKVWRWLPLGTYRQALNEDARWEWKIALRSERSSLLALGLVACLSVLRARL